MPTTDLSLETRTRLFPVVILEDEEGVNRLIAKRLQRMGFETVSAGSGEAGISEITSRSGQVILLLDYSLSDMEAPSVLDHLEEKLGEVPPFVVITGQGDEKVAVAMMKRGARDYLLKDSEFLDLVPHVIGRVHDQLEKEQQLTDTADRLHDTEENLHRTEASLHRAEATFESALEYAPIGMGIATLDGKWHKVNRAICEMTRYSASDLLGEEVLNLFPPLPRHRVFKAMTELLDTAIPVINLEEALQCSDGGQLWCNIRAGVVMNENKPSSYIIQMQDVTAKREIRMQVRKQAALLDQTNDAILVLDGNRSISFWNSGAERLWGWNRDEVSSKNAHDLVGANSDTAPLAALLDETVRDGKAESELSITTREGELRTIDIRCNLLEDEDDSVLAICNDVTEKKKIEQHYLRSQRLEGIGQLASGIAHDLNNVLAPVQYSFPLFRDPTTDPSTIQEIVDTLESSVKRGTSIVRQLLAFGRGVESEYMVFQCRHLIREIVKMVRQTFPANIRIIDQVPNDLWTIRGDETQFHQILLNLCVNARDAMPEGGSITISAANLGIDERFVAMEPRASAGNWVCLTVTDTGEGIPPEVQERIFDPFFTTKEIGKGTGLGLSTVMGIIKSHNGFIDLDSEVSKGTEFKIYIPAESLDVPSETVAEKAIPRGNGQLVLVVEDDEAICITTKQLLERWGYKCRIARTGIEGAALFNQEAGEIDLVIASIKLVELDGATLVRIVKRIDPSMPAIVTTGYPDDRLLSPLEKEHGVRVMIKPHSSEQLLQAVGEMIAGGK